MEKKQVKSLDEIVDFINKIGLSVSHNCALDRANTLSSQLTNEGLYVVSIYNKRSFKGKTKSVLNPEREWIIEKTQCQHW